MTTQREYEGDGKLDETDVRALVRLLGKVAGLPEPVAVRKRVLMDELCELVDADVWFWNLVRIQEDGEFAGIEVLHGGLDERRLTLYFESSYGGPESFPEVNALVALMQKGERFTRRRQQLIPDEAVYGNGKAAYYRKEIGMDQGFYAFQPVGDGIWSCIGMHRNWGRPPFSPRQTRLAHIVLSEVTWLHRAALPGEESEKIPKLSRRLRTVFGLLMEGHGRQQIAGHLGLSEYTVRDYMSQIYRHFGVRTQVELLRRLTVGDGADTAGKADA